MAGPDERLFLRVVEAGSLSAAAAQLGTTPSTVSRRLAALEQRLGVKLLRRSSRRSTPTEAGARYAAGLRSLVQQLDALEADVTGLVEHPRGLLRVAAPVGFGARFVVPVAHELQEQAPDLEVDLVLGSGFANLEQEGLDLAIRIGRLPDSSLRARRLGSVPRVLVASPEYLRRRGRPATAADLSAHPFILYRRGDGVARIPITDPGGTEHVVTARGPIAVNSVEGMARLVELGRGLHYGPLWAFGDALAEGRVERVLPDHGLAPYPLSALYPPTLHLPAKVRRFIDAMQQRVRREPTLGPP